MMYAANFAQLLDLPEKVRTIIPLLQQIPERYRCIFADGCHKAMTQAAPARFSGAFDYDFQAELYRGGVPSYWVAADLGETSDFRLVELSEGSIDRPKRTLTLRQTASPLLSSLTGIRKRP